ncbi:HEPN domain-containing protein [Micromonospora thermarum]|uniref:ApeA N-terminal domain-containing protein n=1 Tax=Micromonospora thermarum TaxID=2720024 RepID=A0ABX0ZJ44_9ACTN|nr:HEPN domain-containing protein [Micromonospora thermarum]NJP35810.1 hypothetical protein [Micromonospora thermarum]
MQPLDISGSFWLPGSERIKRHGRLVFDRQDGGTLHLTAPVGELVGDDLVKEIGGGTRSRILGVVEEINCSRPVTLIDCGYVSRRKYFVKAILVDGHFEDHEQTAFESVIVRLRDGAAWVNKDAVMVEVDDAVEGVHRREMVCRLDRPVASEAGFARGKVVLDFRWSREDIELKSFKVNQWPEFVIEYDELTPLSVIYDDIGHIFNLSSLCNDRADSFDSVKVYRSDHPVLLRSGDGIEGTRRDIEVKARLGDFTRRKEPKHLTAHDVLVPLDVLGGIQAIAKWLDVAPSLTPIVGSLLTMRSDGIYSENRFLNMSSAAEGLHRATVGGRHMPQSQFRTLRRKIREGAVPPEHHAWFNAVMAHANDPSLDRRLRELVREVQGISQFLIGSNLDAWVRAVKKVRNNLTHLDEGRESFDGADLHWLAESLFDVTRLCLLRRIGLGDQHLPQIAKSIRMGGTFPYLEAAVRNIAGASSESDPEKELQ